MAGFTDLPFRRLVRECGGCGLATTDLLNCRSVLAGHPTALRLAETNDADSPVGMCPYGNDTDPLPEAADWAVGRGIDVLDINMGCPVDKSVQKNGGSLLLCDPERTVRLVERILQWFEAGFRSRQSCVWAGTTITSPVPDWPKCWNQLVLLPVAIHGRTTEMKFRGQVRLEGIGRVVEAVRDIPVLGNGDIESPQDAEHMWHNGMRWRWCRAANRQPWLLSRIHQLLEHGEDPLGTGPPWHAGGHPPPRGVVPGTLRRTSFAPCAAQSNLSVRKEPWARQAAERSIPTRRAHRRNAGGHQRWLERPAPRRRDQQSQSLACPSQP